MAELCEGQKAIQRRIKLAREVNHPAGAYALHLYRYNPIEEEKRADRDRKGDELSQSTGGRVRKIRWIFSLLFPSVVKSWSSALRNLAALETTVEKLERSEALQRTRARYLYSIPSGSKSPRLHPSRHGRCNDPTPSRRRPQGKNCRQHAAVALVQGQETEGDLEYTRLRIRERY